MGWGWGVPVLRFGVMGWDGGILVWEGGYLDWGLGSLLPQAGSWAGIWGLRTGIPQP